MKKKSKQQPADPKAAHHLADFHRLPEETKELMELKERHEKATGPELVATTRNIHEKAPKSRP
jgi:hypothetical protein